MRGCTCHKELAQTETERYLYSRCVDIKLPEDSKRLLEKLVADSYIGYVRSIIVIQAIDVLHDTGAIGLNSCEDEKVLQIPKWRKKTLVHTK